MRGVADEDETGNFEVTAAVLPGGERRLLFSKQRGMGFCDKPQKLDALVRRIQALRVASA